MVLHLHFYLRVFLWRSAVPKKVLIVDDSQAELHLMQSMLQQGGFHSVGISDPTRIEEAIEEEHPNVILLDVVMPLAQWLSSLPRSEEPAALLQHSRNSGHVQIRAQRSLLGRTTGRERLRFQALHPG